MWWNGWPTKPLQKFRFGFGFIILKIENFGSVFGGKFKYTEPKYIIILYFILNILYFLNIWLWLFEIRFDYSKNKIKQKEIRFGSFALGGGLPSFHFKTIQWFTIGPFFVQSSNDSKFQNSIDPA